MKSKFVKRETVYKKLSGLCERYFEIAETTQDTWVKENYRAGIAALKEAITILC